jgi:hypothetical protein
MKRKKLLQDELEQVEDKLRAEMAWFRNEIKPLKERQRQILDELENLI